jgi:hypothetical protein
MSAQYTPGPWFAMRSCATGLYTVGRNFQHPTIGRALEMMLTATGRERTFKTEAAARAAIAKSTGSAS